MSGWQVGIDIGGTFTDVVAMDITSGRTLSAKVRTRAEDPIESLLNALEAVGLQWDDVDDLVHGTTIVTNAIIQDKLAKIAFVTTEGFSDVLAIGRQNRRYLYRLDLPPKLPPQVPEELCFEVRERMTHVGRVLTPLEPTSVDALIQSIRESDVEAVAVSLLHAYANSSHEEQLARRLIEAVPHVALSHQVSPEAREFERASTTALNAGVMPLVSNYIDRLEERRPVRSRLHFFHSASGMCSPSAVRDLPLALALSGPAAGVAAASQIAREIHVSHALTFDMGGTTTDVCLIVGGEAEITADRALAGRPLRMAAVAVESIGAGGSSIAQFDGSILRVGPESAGADPGPACYGLGGERPTVSDACMLLGYLEDGATFGGNIRLSHSAAEKAIAPLATALGLDVLATARGIVKVANNAMSEALRRVTVERGVDPRVCTLIAFGGAGPMHAVDVARLVGIEHVVVPKYSGAFSALGCMSADLSYTQQHTFHMSGDAWDQARLDAAQAAMVDHVFQAIHDAGSEQIKTVWIAALRYLGQSYAVEIRDPSLGDPAKLADEFNRKHAQLYGFSTDGPWELVALRLTVSVPRNLSPFERIAVQRSGAPTLKKSRQCIFGHTSMLSTPEYERAGLPPLDRIVGPAIITDASSTVIVPPASSVMADSAGHLHVDLEAAE